MADLSTSRGGVAPGGPRQAGRTAELVLGLLVALVLHSLAVTYQATRAEPKVDFLTVWGAGQTWPAATGYDLYSPAARRLLGEALGQRAAGRDASPRQRQVTAATLKLYDGRLDTTGTPLLYALGGLLTTGDYDLDERLFTAASLAAAVGGVLCLGRSVGVDWPTLLVVLVLMLSCWLPVRSDLTVGNLGLLQLGGLGLAACLATSPRTWRVAAAGLVLGLGATAKPTTALAALLAAGLVWLLRGRRPARDLGLGVAAGVLAGVGLAALYAGSPWVWTDWLTEALPRAAAGAYPLAQGNLGLVSLASSVTGLAPALPAAGLLLAGLAAAAWLARRHPAPALACAEPPLPGPVAVVLLAAGLGGTITVLSARLVWLHYYVLMLPAALYLLRPSPETEPAAPATRVARWLTGLALVLPTYLPMVVLPRTHTAHSVVMNAAAALLYGLLLHDLWRSARRAPSPTGA